MQCCKHCRSGRLEQPWRPTYFCDPPQRHARNAKGNFTQQHAVALTTPGDDNLIDCSRGRKLRCYGAVDTVGNEMGSGTKQIPYRPSRLGGHADGFIQFAVGTHPLGMPSWRGLFKIRVRQPVSDKIRNFFALDRQTSSGIELQSSGTQAGTQFVQEKSSRPNIKRQQTVDITTDFCRRQIGQLDRPANIQKQTRAIVSAQE